MKQKSGAGNPLFIVMLLVMAGIQWWMFRTQPQQPAPKVVAPASVSHLPAGLQLQTGQARDAFTKAIAQLIAGVKNTGDARKKNYNDAVSALQDVAKQDGKSPDGLCATIEIADIQFRLLDEKDQAASELSALVQENEEPGPEVSVFNGSRWTRQPAVTYAASRYELYSTTIDYQNSHNGPFYRLFAYKFIDAFAAIFRAIGASAYSGAMALVLLGIIVSVLLTPVRNWQYRSMGKMGKIQPQLKRLQEQYKGQPEELNKRTMEFYKEQGVNPMNGCLPALVQLPFMWWLYFAIRQYQYRFSHAHFLWIGSQFSLTHTHWATPKGPIFAISLGHMDIPLLLVYTASMYVSSKFMPVTSPDPAQAEQAQRTSAMMSLIMPVMFYFYNWPSAFTLYWLAMNVAQILITVFYLRHHPELKAFFNKAGAADEPGAARGARKDVPIRVEPGKAAGRGGVRSGSRVGSAESSVDAAGEDRSAVNGTDDQDEEAQANSPVPGAKRRIEPRNRRKARTRRF